MFFSLLIATLLISVAVSVIVARLFKGSIEHILNRVLSDSIYYAWVRYLLFAIYVVGISNGVRIWDLERYISPGISPRAEQGPLVLTSERWVLEVYRTMIGTLQGIAWLLLVFLVFALIAFVIVRIGEMKYRSKKEPQSAEQVSDQ
ncbi:MAG TPA: hypothetical protein PLP42_13015 [Acidobacteriota bacterium]|nr:hypothetical protein [Acidobacteriota bacterium]